MVPQVELPKESIFLNGNKNDSALVNINRFIGFFETDERVIQASANIGAHELGHLLGLRHGDSFGAPGKLLHFVGPECFVYDQMQQVQLRQQFTTYGCKHSIARTPLVDLL